MVTHGCFMIQHFPRDHRIFQRGSASMIYGHHVGLCDVCEEEGRANTTERAAHSISSQTVRAERAQSELFCIFQLRRGATCTVNRRRQGMWCTWKGWHTTGPAAPTRTLTASASGATASWVSGGFLRAQCCENNSNCTLSASLRGWLSIITLWAMGRFH